MPIHIEDFQPGALEFDQVSDFRNPCLLYTSDAADDLLQV